MRGQWAAARTPRKRRKGEVVPRARRRRPINYADRPGVNDRADSNRGRGESVPAARIWFPGSGAEVARLRRELIYAARSMNLRGEPRRARPAPTGAIYRGRPAPRGLENGFFTRDRPALRFLTVSAQFGYDGRVERRSVLADWLWTFARNAPRDQVLSHCRLYLSAFYFAGFSVQVKKALHFNLWY